MEERLIYVRRQPDPAPVRGRSGALHDEPSAHRCDLRICLEKNADWTTIIASCACFHPQTLSLSVFVSVVHLFLFSYIMCETLLSLGDGGLITLPGWFKWFSA